MTVTLQLPFPPMDIFAIAIEHPLDMTVSAFMIAIRASIVGPLRDTSGPRLRLATPTGRFLFPLGW